MKIMSESFGSLDSGLCLEDIILYLTFVLALAFKEAWRLVETYPLGIVECSIER